MSKKVKRWTKKEEKFLLNNYGKKSISYLKRILNASETQIKNKMYRLNGSARVSVNKNMITTYDIENFYGIDSTTTISNIESGDLRASLAPKGTSVSKYHINVSDFYNWIYSKPHLVRGKKIIRNVILPEPAWLDDFLVEQSKKREGTNWSKEEDKILLYYREIKFEPYKSIAEKLGRTPRSLSKRYCRIVENRKKQKQKGCIIND